MSLQGTPCHSSKKGRSRRPGRPAGRQHRRYRVPAVSLSCASCMCPKGPEMHRLGWVILCAGARFGGPRKYPRPAVVLICADLGNLNFKTSIEALKLAQLAQVSGLPLRQTFPPINAQLAGRSTDAALQKVPQTGGTFPRPPACFHSAQLAQIEAAAFPRSAHPHRIPAQHLKRPLDRRPHLTCRLFLGLP